VRKAEILTSTIFCTTTQHIHTRTRTRTLTYKHDAHTQTHTRMHTQSHTIITRTQIHTHSCTYTHTRIHTHQLELVVLQVLVHVAGVALHVGEHGHEVRLPKEGPCAGVHGQAGHHIRRGEQALALDKCVRTCVSVCVCVGTNVGRHRGMVLLVTQRTCTHEHKPSSSAPF